MDSSSFSWCETRRISPELSWESCQFRQPVLEPLQSGLRGSLSCSWGRLMQELPSEQGIPFPSRRWITSLPLLLPFPSLLLARLLDTRLWLTKSAEADNFFCYLRVVFVFLHFFFIVLMCPIVKYQTIQVQGGISCMEELKGEEWLISAAVKAVGRLSGCVCTLGTVLYTGLEYLKYSLWLPLNITSFEKAGLGDW